MARKHLPPLSTLIKRLLSLRPCGDGKAIDSFVDVLAGTVAADAYALFRAHPSRETVAILGGRGLNAGAERWPQETSAPHITKQAVNFPDKMAIAAVGSFNCDPVLHHEKARSFVMSRVEVGDDYLVTMALRRGKDPFSRHEIERFAAVAGVINLVGRSCFLEKELDGARDRDSLTGLERFRTFHDRLRQELSRARRGSGSVTIGILGVHRPEGVPPTEPQLLATSAVLAEQLRDFDTLVRYSPSEFAFILPDLRGTEGVRVMERIQGDVDSALASLTEPSWTCIGISGYPDDAATVERVIEIAEAAANQLGEAGRPGVSRWKG